MTALELTPPMPARRPPAGDAARWVGAIDVDDLRPHPDEGLVRFVDAEGYGAARLLVRRGGAVAGYVTVPIEDGLASVAAIRDRLRGTDVPAAAQLADASQISVVICTRDRPDLLREALTSVMALDPPPAEVIVVDNAAATTSTADLVALEFPTVRLVAEPVAGLSNARNAGLRASTGRFVAFTDDDVVVDPSWVGHLASAFAADPTVACVTGLVPSGELSNDVQAWFDARVSWSKTTRRRVFRLSEPPQDLPMFPFCVGEYGTGANFAVDRDVVLRLGGFDPALGVGTPTQGGEDLDMFTRLLFADRALVLEPNAIVWHRHRDDLPALRKQAIGYGRGLGAWLTTVVLRPRMLASAIRRSPRAVVRLVRKPMTTVENERVTISSELASSARSMSRLELFNVVLGPGSYLRARWGSR